MKTTWASFILELWFGTYPARNATWVNIVWFPPKFSASITPLQRYQWIVIAVCFRELFTPPPKIHPHQVNLGNFSFYIKLSYLKNCTLHFWYNFCLFHSYFSKQLRDKFNAQKEDCSSHFRLINEWDSVRQKVQEGVQLSHDLSSVTRYFRIDFDLRWTFTVATRSQENTLWRM